MTAKRRARKFNEKRNHTDVDAYTERYRRASEAAKRARDEARSRTAGAAEVEEVRVDIEDFKEGVRSGTIRLVDVNSLYPEEYFAQDEEFYDQRIVDHTRKEAVRSPRASDAAPEFQRFASAASDGSRAIDRFNESYGKSSHKHHFEREVNTLPLYSHSEDCSCAKAGDHWTTLGEN